MSAHGGCGGLTMRTSHTESFVRTGEHAQHLGPFFHIEAVLTEEYQLLVLLRDGRCIYHEGVLGILTSMRNLIHLFLVVNQCSFLLHLSGQWRRCLVVAGHHQSHPQEVTGNGTHSNATDTYEIYCFYIFLFHVSFCLFQPSFIRL